MYMTTISDEVIYVHKEQIEDIPRFMLIEHLTQVGQMFYDKWDDFKTEELRARALKHFEQCRYTFVNTFYEQKFAINGAFR